jgi:hypothetical protein
MAAKKDARFLLLLFFEVCLCQFLFTDARALFIVNGEYEQGKR